MNLYKKSEIPKELLEYFEPAELGLEETPNLYVERLVEVFREVKRVLKEDGTLWLNLGDSYSSHKDCKSIGQTLAKGTNRETAHEMELGLSRVRDSKMLKAQGLKNKDLIGIPWKVAFALQADGWWLRQDIIWHKPNPMPESVTDRCTKAHEYVFLLSKSDMYYFDHEAIQEEATGYDGRKDTMMKGSDKYAVSCIPNQPVHTMASNGHERWKFKNLQDKGQQNHTMHVNRQHGEEYLSPVRNKRSVWTVATKPYKAAHFATFPENLIKPMILAGCPSGGIVLDIFGGSGTTASVSKSLGRKSISIELNEKYIELQMNRTSQNYFNFETDSETLA